MINKCSINELAQNLKDSGCDDCTIDCFTKLLENDKLSDGLKLLKRHRCCLLTSVHTEQKKIDCLDYLIYRMQKQ